MKKKTVLIVDDHTLIRETWCFIISNHPAYSVIGQTNNGEQAIELAKVYRPDIVIMDIGLSGMNGIDATEQVLRISPGTRILGVSLHTQPTYARKMMQRGATGYVTKNSSKEEMFEALSKVSNGEKYICQEIKNILSDQILDGQEQKQGMEALSQRELEIITHLKKGLSSKEIANILPIAVKTVEVHRHNILKKLNLKNTAALVNYVNSSNLEGV